MSIVDDWPDVNGKTDLCKLLRSGSKQLHKWIGSSKRRRLSGDGKLIVLARRRSWGGGTSFPVNRPPSRGDGWLDSFDFVKRDGWSRAVLPEGVTVKEIAAFDAEKITAVLAFAEPLRSQLGLSRFKLTTSWSEFRLPDYWSNPKKSVEALAKLLAAGGAKTPETRAAARAAVESETRKKKADRAKAKRDHAQVWARAARRGPLPVELRRELEAAIAGTPFEKLKAKLVKLAIPALALREVKLSRKALATPGASRIGGCPDLPAGTPWPSLDGERLSFLLQLNLAEVPPALRGGLPKSGLLSLFMGENESTHDVEHQLLHFPAKGLARAPAPKGAAWRDDQTGLLGEVGLALEPMVTLPGYGTTAFDALSALWGDAVLMDDYFKLCDRLTPKGHVSRLWGWSQKLGPDGRAPSETVLLAIASHRSAGLCFWDAGLLEIELPDVTRLSKSRAFIVTS